MTERKRNNLWMAGVAMLGIVISGITSGLVSYGRISAANSSQEKFNDEVKIELKDLHTNKADYSTMMMIYNQNNADHQDIKNSQEEMQRDIKELLKRKP